MERQLWRGSREESVGKEIMRKEIAEREKRVAETWTSQLNDINSNSS